MNSNFMIPFGKKITDDVIANHFQNFMPSIWPYHSQYLATVFKKYKILPPHLVYFCPLCVENYIIAFGNHKEATAEFSLDHIPPESVGGKYKLLTCKKCNNDAGIFEAELSSLLDLGNISDPSKKVILPKVMLSKKGSEELFKGTMVRNEKGNDIQFNENAKNYQKNLE